MFWDSSAIVPYLVIERSSAGITTLLERDRTVTIWWATPVECVSALERRRRDGELDPETYREARHRLLELDRSCYAIQAHRLVRERAERLLALHPLRAADALQLAAALVAVEDRPQREGFVSLDDRLREAATREGFTVEPASQTATQSTR